MTAPKPWPSTRRFSTITASNHSAPSTRWPIWAPRTYVLRKDNAHARTAYQDFFAAWKDADPDIPILKQAKTEYSNLQ